MHISFTWVKACSSLVSSSNENIRHDLPNCHFCYIKYQGYYTVGFMAGITNWKFVSCWNSVIWPVNLLGKRWKFRLRQWNGKFHRRKIKTNGYTLQRFFQFYRADNFSNLIVHLPVHRPPFQRTSIETEKNTSVSIFFPFGRQTDWKNAETFVKKKIFL